MDEREAVSDEKTSGEPEHIILGALILEDEEVPPSESRLMDEIGNVVGRHARTLVSAVASELEGVGLGQPDQLEMELGVRLSVTGSIARILGTGRDADVKFRFRWDNLRSGNE